MSTVFHFVFILFVVGTAALARDSNLVQIAEQLGATTLVNYIKAAGLESALTDNGPFTVLGPTDGAFDALPADVKDALTKDPSLLKKVLEFHVVDGWKYSSHLANNLLVPSLILGLDIRVNIYDKTVTVDGAEVTLADQNATNGVIHVIDKVMYPLPTGRIPMILAGMKNLSTLVFAAASAQLIGALNGNGPLTLFASNNAAFDNLPAGKFSDLLSNQTALIDLLKYHVLPGSYYSKGLTSGQQTALDGKNVSVTANSGSVSVNSAKVLTADIPSMNGVIHVIDNVLIPPN